MIYGGASPEEGPMGDTVYAQLPPLDDIGENMCLNKCEDVCVSIGENTCLNKCEDVCVSIGENACVFE